MLILTATLAAVFDGIALAADENIQPKKGQITKEQVIKMALVDYPGTNVGLFRQRDLRIGKGCLAGVF